jgi:hypothetical protein
MTEQPPVNRARRFCAELWEKQCPDVQAFVSRKPAEALAAE